MTYYVSYFETTNHFKVVLRNIYFSFFHYHRDRTIFNISILEIALDSVLKVYVISLKHISQKINGL